MATHSRILAWRIPSTEQPGGLQSMGFSIQVYWSGLLCPPPGDLPNPGIEPVSLMSPSLAGGFFTASAIKRIDTCIRITESVCCTPETNTL